MLRWVNMERVVEGVMPDLLHIVPVGDNTMLYWTVVDKATGQAIGWAGMEQRSDGVWGETGVAIGPAFIGKGYGKQILNCLTDYARDHLGAKRFMACCRKENTVSRRLQLNCGFSFSHTEEAIHPRDHIPYTLEYYKKEL